MESRDCTWCGSAQSIEYGVCQVCLMRFPEPEGVEDGVVISLQETEEARRPEPGLGAAGTAVSE